MAGTKTTEQAVVDADSARNASDILALIADYENEVGTVVDEPVAETKRNRTQKGPEVLNPQRLRKEKALLPCLPEHPLTPQPRCRPRPAPSRESPRRVQ